MVEQLLGKHGSSMQARRRIEQGHCRSYLVEARAGRNFFSIDATTT
jgi:hypothetical protein